MGKILEQCCVDAWDVIQGKKKIVGNKVVNIEEINDIENEHEEGYGWLAPEGTFYFVEFGNHQAWEAEHLLELYREEKISYEQARIKDNENAGDLLIKMGWILIHNPHGYGIKITRNLSKRITNKQKEYLCKIKKIDEMEKDFI